MFTFGVTQRQTKPRTGLVVLAIMVLTGCRTAPPRAGPPDWWNSAPTKTGERMYFVGVSGMVADDREGLRRAEEDASAQIARVVAAEIRSETRTEVSRLQTDRQTEVVDSISSTSRCLAEERLRDVRRDDRYALADGKGAWDVRVRMSAPLSELRPTPERRREQLADLALARSRRGDYSGAAHGWQTLCLLAPDDPKHPRNAAACLETLGLWQDALDALERFQSRHPDPAASAEFAKDVERLRRKIADDLGRVEWASTIGRIRELFAHGPREDLSLSTDRQIYPMLDPSGKRQGVVLTVKTAKTAYLNLIWLDAEGLFRMDDYATSEIPARQWNDKLQLSTGTVPGDVTLLAIASQQRLNLPIREVRKTKVDERDPATLTRLRALESLLRGVLTGEKAPAALVDFKVMP